MKISTFADKTFLIENNEARIRRDDNLALTATFAAGDPLPPGALVGAPKIIPKRTEVRVTEVRVDEARTVFVRAQPVNATLNLPVGWTLAANLEGQFLNEIIGFAPDNLELPPQGDNFTVTDNKALIRNGPPDFTSTGTKLMPGAFVLVAQASKNTDPLGKFVKLSEGSLVAGLPQPGAELGWTAAANLTPGWGTAFSSPSWLDEKGPNACWERGRYLGPKLLVNIVGVGSEMEQITLDSLEPYLRLIEAAAKKNLVIAVESGFRTFPSQVRLFQAFKAGQGNKAAEPGRSNHQHGQAFDLNTRGFDGSPVYDWLKKNGPRLSFIRTVNKEHWHWEYRPEEAAALAAKGKFALASVTR
ncbi:MAG: D-alanyl-D-alanine carboxypeptidase family protein [Acidobacteria bacterium]|nr:D-alanyl-D-alanine carboxypeptidase family protein [Acidobacteriota bacterium]MBI3428258.1 D-alanyl-D-alanine carboxypeptidase family protein [Acidobacteriota bacterium]